MIIHVLNKELDVIGLIEDYYSLTWAERYYVCGDFELELPIGYDSSPLIEFGNFLQISDSDRLMIIEDIKPSTTENLSSLVVQGASAESILKRRSLLNSINISGNVVEVMNDIITTHIITPMTFQRYIEIFEGNFSWPELTAEVKDQLEVQTVYDAIVTICKSVGYGFKLLKEIPLVQNKLVFTVYAGTDRSYSQEETQFVIFSENFGNVISSSFYLSEKGKVNVVLVSTDDIVHHTVFVTALDAVEEPSDLDRFETFLVTSINRDLGDGDPLTNDDVMNIINTKGRALIEERKTVGVFEGDFLIDGTFKYGVDFFMGDIVQCLIEGRNTKARIIELVRSYSTEGAKSYIAMDFIV